MKMIKIIFYTLKKDKKGRKDERETFSLSLSLIHLSSHTCLFLLSPGMRACIRRRRRASPSPLLLPFSLSPPTTEIVSFTRRSAGACPHLSLPLLPSLLLSPACVCAHNGEEETSSPFFKPLLMCLCGCLLLPLVRACMCARGGVIILPVCPLTLPLTDSPLSLNSTSSSLYCMCTCVCKRRGRKREREEKFLLLPITSLHARGQRKFFSSILPSLSFTLSRFPSLLLSLFFLSRVMEIVHR